MNVLSDLMNVNFKKLPKRGTQDNMFTGDSIGKASHRFIPHCRQSEFVFSDAVDSRFKHKASFPESKHESIIRAIHRPYHNEKRPFKVSKKRIDIASLGRTK